MSDPDFIDLPLVFQKLERARSTRGDYPSGKDFLDFFCGVGEAFDSPMAEVRYYDLIREDGKVFAFPNHERFLATFANPLKYAKVNYVLGNYHGTIALSGFVAEMCTVFIYDFALWCLEGEARKRCTVSFQKFEHMRQSDRIHKLHSYGIINDAYVKTLKELNKLRNTHLHNYAISCDKTKEDAQEAYGLAVTILLAATGQKIEGSFFDGWRKGAHMTLWPLHPLVREFLDSKWRPPKRSPKRDDHSNAI